ncbi:MAG: glucose 1-dehydrogenase [Rhodospirillaceae bacterium]|nr:glucose 1-dehydrogenase [Rhodospirillaceae bacterium]
MTAKMMDRFSLAGQRALITGASRGLGLGCAEVLAEAGAEVVLVGRTKSELDQAVTQITAKGGKASALVCDVTNTDQVREVLSTRAPVHVLVNNAGTNIPEPFTDVSEEHFDRIFDINVRAAFFVAQIVAAKMIAAKIKGSIIHMSSQMGHVGSPNRTVYCASKHAIEGLTKAMAVELAPHGIRVNSVAPTFIETPMTKPMLDKPEFKSFVVDRIPLGHMGQIADVTAAVLYLAAPASALVTGTSLKVDGGWTAQ